MLLFIVFSLFGVLVLIVPRLAVIGAEDERAEIDQIIQHAPKGFFTPATLPTATTRIEAIYPEWEQSEVVLISVPLASALVDPYALGFVLEFLEAVVDHVPVGVLYNRDEERLLGRFISKIESRPKLQAGIDRIDFVESRVQSFWIRDFGPQFGMAGNGDLLTIDSIYRLIDLESVYDPRSVSDYNVSKQRDYANDLSPNFVANYLRSERDFETKLIRPPLHLHGGDFAVDGNGNVFVSEDTITENGGDIEFIEQVFERYYGSINLHALSGPKGNSAKHLDLLFKVATPDIVFLNRAPGARDNESAHSRKTRVQIERRLSLDLDYLKRNLPEKRILSLPMPSLAFASREKQLHELKREIVNVACRNAKVSVWWALEGDPNHPETVNANNAVQMELLLKTGVKIDFNLESHLELAAQALLGVGLDEYYDTYVEEQAIYRSYTNSLIVVNGEGKSLILLPRYLPQLGETPEQYAEFEAEVERAYLSAYPNAQLEWIGSDAITSLGGSIHCMSIGVPLRKNLRSPRS